MLIQNVKISLCNFSLYITRTRDSTSQNMVWGASVVIFENDATHLNIAIVGFVQNSCCCWESRSFDLPLLASCNSFHY